MLIATAADPAASIAGWRMDPSERYDFVAGNLRLEVKSSLARRRVHGFSFEQCVAPTGCRGIIASIFVEKSAGGLSFESLVARIAGRLTASPSSMFILEKTLASTLGAGLPEALAFSFDDALARSSLAFFDLNAISAIREPVCLLLSQIRFVSDLSQSQTLDLDTFAKSCSYFLRFRPIDLNCEMP